MKSLLFIIIIALCTRDLIAQVMPDDIVINIKYPPSSDSESFYSICKGTVIHPRVVMTAAECVNGLSPGELQVENSWHRVSSNVLNIIIHPEYVEDNGSNNFAILIIDKIIIMRNSIACLAKETFLSNADLKKCSATLITEMLYNRMNSSSDEPISPLDCESSDGYNENPHFFRDRQVEMMNCKPVFENSQCFTYYFAHYSLRKKCLPYTPELYEFINLHTSFVYNVVDWVQQQVQKYTNASECLFVTV